MQSNVIIPDFISIFKTTVFYLEYIPRELIKPANKTLSYLITQVLKYNDYKSWVGLALFARVALIKNKRGGKSNQQRNENSMRNTFKRIQKGEIINIWTEMIQKQQSQKDQPTVHKTVDDSKCMNGQIPIKTQRKMKKLMSKGKTKKALRLIKSGGLSDLSNDDNLNNLKSKFPKDSQFSDYKLNQVK